MPVSKEQNISNGSEKKKKKNRKKSSFMPYLYTAGLPIANTGKGHDQSGAMFCQFIVDANLPLAAADNIAAAVKMTFSFSKIVSIKVHFFFILF